LSDKINKSIGNAPSYIEEHLLERKLVGVWEVVNDSSPMTAEGYGLNLEGYFLEMWTLPD